MRNRWRTLVLSVVLFVVVGLFVLLMTGAFVRAREIRNAAELVVFFAVLSLYFYREYEMYSRLKPALTANRKNRVYLISIVVPPVIAVLTYLVSMALARSNFFEWTGASVLTVVMIGAVPIWAALFLRHRLVRRISKS